KTRCLFVAVVIFPFAIWGVFVEHYILAGARYVNLDVLAVATKVQIGLAAAWGLMIAAALMLPSSERAGRALMHSTAVLYFVTVAQGSYLPGFFTSLFPGVTFIAGVVVGLILYDRGVALPTVILLLVFPVFTTLAEIAGLVPYAPLLSSAPFADGAL